MSPARSIHPHRGAPGLVCRRECPVRNLRRFKADYRVIPRTTFTEPEVATVGLTEREAESGSVPVEVTRFPLQELDRAIVESAERGFVKVLTTPGGDRILGVTIVGEHAGELISEFVLAMRWNLGLNRILGDGPRLSHLFRGQQVRRGCMEESEKTGTGPALLERYHNWRRRGFQSIVGPDTSR